MGRSSDFIPGAFFRRYAFHFVIFAASLAVYIFVFAFFAKETAAACAELYRFDNTTCREAVVSSSDPKEDGDSFYNLNGIVSFTCKGKRLFCDAYMTKNGVRYDDNAILFRGALNDGECLISRNAAKEYGLGKGDEIVADGAKTMYRIVDFLTPQSGLDGRYGYDGVMVLAYNDALTAGAKYSNLSGECDVYYGRESSTFLVNLRGKAVEKIVTAAIIAAAAYVACFAVCEYFMFSPRYKDYVLLNNEGLPRRKLMAKITFDNLVRYALPLLVTAAGFSVSLGYYGGFYLLPAAIYFAFSVISGVTYSAVLIGRLTKCHKIREA